MHRTFAQLNWWAQASAEQRAKVDPESIVLQSPLRETHHSEMRLKERKLGGDKLH